MPTPLFAASASPYPIRLAIKKARANERRWRREAEALDALLETRLAQIAAGTWPPARPDDTTGA